MAIRITLFLLGLLLVSPAWADDYAEPTLENFAHTLMRFKAIDMMNDALLDDYAMITDCEIYENFYSNDFKWSQVRSFMRDSIKMKSDTFPDKYYYEAELQLDRYDFKSKNFRFTDNTAVKGVNTFRFNFVNRTGQPRCYGRNLENFPSSYEIVIGAPVTIGGLPFSEEDANLLLRYLEESKNIYRIIYVRFYMTVNHIEPLRKSELKSGSQKYIQPGVTGDEGMRVEARLDSVKFYADPAMSKLIYSYSP